MSALTPLTAELPGLLGDLTGLENAEARALLAAVTAFVLALAAGRPCIRRLRASQILEHAERTDSERLSELHRAKSKTPTMGGIVLLAALAVSTVLWADLDNRLVLLLLAVTAACGMIGFADDWVKLRSEKKGLSARGKLACQLLVGLAAGLYLYLEPLEALQGGDRAGTALFLPLPGKPLVALGALYIALVAGVIVGTSNAVNLTDGLDGLAAGCGVLVGMTFVAVALLAGYEPSSAYLGIPHVRGALEVAVFAAALVGAGLGFLWFNCHPAQVFMGDTGALSLGGALGLIAVLCKQEILLLVAGGVLVAEAASVILQVVSFKLRRRRIFLIAPLHHHYQFKGWPEAKVTVRFWIAGALLGFAALLALNVL